MGPLYLDNTNNQKVLTQPCNDSLKSKAKKNKKNEFEQIVQVFFASCASEHQIHNF